MQLDTGITARLLRRRRWRWTTGARRRRTLTKMDITTGRRRSGFCSGIISRRLREQDRWWGRRWRRRLELRRDFCGYGSERRWRCAVLILSVLLARGGTIWSRLEAVRALAVAEMRVV